MDILELISKKKKGEKLTKEEWEFFVNGVCSKTIKDYQTTSMLMAICMKDIDYEETSYLTMAMAHSGKVLNLDDIGCCFDKHSTGGVSDTTALIIVPTLASLGVKIAKMSGRSLGFTGGTVDKVEVFKGYNAEISIDRFKEIVKTVGGSIISQSEEFALADKILYKLRSDSGTVDNIGLIASSIMSKKIACGAKIILLDVKYGAGAFMKTKEDAKKLATVMTKIGEMANLKVSAVISSMDQPLTNYVGNKLEVYSALKVLSGEKNSLYELASFLCAKGLMLAKGYDNIEECIEIVKNQIASKKPLEKLKEIILAHGGSTYYVDHIEELLPQNNHFDILAERDGYIESINTELLGDTSHFMQKVNGVTVRQDDVGVILNKRIGDKVQKGEKLLTAYYNQLDDENDIRERLGRIYHIGDNKVEVKLIEEVIN